MGTFGTVLGSILGVGGLIITIWATWVLTDNFLGFLLFPLFGIIGGIALGALNSRKAKTQVKYKNEYVFYATASFIAIIGLAVYFLMFALGAVEAKVVDPSTFNAQTIIIGSAIASISMIFGFGLVVANAIDQ